MAILINFKIFYHEKLLLPLLFALPVFLFSQGAALNVGYDYMSRSAGFIGGDYRLNSTHDSSLTIGAGTFLLGMDKKFTVLPEAHVTYGSIFFGELSATTRNLKPTVGFSFLNLFQMKFGYSIPYDKKYDLKGFTLGLHIFIGKSEFYDYLDMGM